MHTLHWKDHSNLMMKNIANLYENNLFVDCTLNVQGRSVQVHKNILAAVSPFFEQVFSEKPSKRNFVLEDITFQDLKSVLDFIYHGKIEVVDDRLQSFLDLAELLELPDEAVKSTNDKNQKEASSDERRPGSPDVDNEQLGGNTVCVLEDISSLLNDSDTINLMEYGKNLKLTKANNVVRCEMDLPVINSEKRESRSLLDIEIGKSSCEEALAKKQGFPSSGEFLREVYQSREMKGSSSADSEAQTNSDAVKDLGKLSAILNEAVQKNPITTLHFGEINGANDGVMLLDTPDTCESEDGNDIESNGVSEGDPDEPPRKKNRSYEQNNDSEYADQSGAKEGELSKSMFPELFDSLEDIKKQNRELANQIIQNQCVLMHALSNVRDIKDMGYAIDPTQNFKKYGIQFPLETMEEYARFSVLLEKEPVFRESVTSMLNNCVDKNHAVPKSIVSMLKTLLKKSLASSFCASKPTDSKHVLKSTPLYYLIRGIISNRRTICNMETNEKDFSRHLSAVLSNVYKWNEKLNSAD